MDVDLSPPFQASSATETIVMQSVQRRFGKLLPRTADEAQVGVLLKDFDDADKMLAKVPLPYPDVDTGEVPLLNRSSSLTPRRLGGTLGGIS